MIGTLTDGDGKPSPLDERLRGMAHFSPSPDDSVPSRFSLSDRWVWGIFALAVIIRVGTLLYNLTLDLPPHWGYLPRTGLGLAWSDFGRISLSDLAQHFHISAQEALQSWYLNDRGLVYLYLLLNAITGHVTYLQVQIVNLTIDALMIFPVMVIAGKLGEKKGAIYLAGLVYALFVPQIQMAVSPDYNSWFSYFLILLTLLVLQLTAAMENHRSRQAAFLAIGLAIANVLANEFRSVLALFCLGAAGWYWMASTIRLRRFRLPAAVWKGVATLVFCGIVTVGAAASINSAVRGEASPVRSSLGHNFWTGVGQFANPYGLRDDDASVGGWYTRETGLTNTGNTMGVKYNRWLIVKAEQFIRENPGLYMSMVVRRALHLLFPNMAFTLIADLPSFTGQKEEVRLIEMRKALVAANGWLSFKTISTLFREDLGYSLSLMCRVALMVLMPLGLIAAFFTSRRPIMVTLAALPLAYLVICLSPVYATPPVYTSGYTSVIPAVAVGWTGIWVWLRQRLGRRQERTETN